MNIRKKMQSLYLRQFTGEMQEKVNVGVCNMKKLSRSLWWDSLAVGRSLHPGGAIRNNPARADLSQQRCLTPLPRHSTEV